jgi:hypothetical protein
MSSLSSWYFIALGDTCAVRFDFSKRIAPPIARISAIILFDLGVCDIWFGRLDVWFGMAKDFRGR